MKKAFKNINFKGSIKIHLKKYDVTQHVPKCVQEINSRYYWVDRKERIIVEAIRIIETYQNAGYKLTLRQLYYQLVSEDIVPNHPTVYKKLCHIIVAGRMGGIIDWDAIEDRGRTPRLPYWVHHIKHALQDTVDQYRLPRQSDQDVYIELWVEKDALSGILYRMTAKYHINLIVNRGYTSCSAVYEAQKRFKRAMADGKKVIILYLGDHDPSGLDMIRDIRERLEGFGLDYYDEPEEDCFTIKHIGLTQAQIKKYNPPPNPAKISDPRAKWYIENFGEISWEVDALKPQILHELIISNVEELIDMNKFKVWIEKEEKDQKILTKFKDKLKLDDGIEG